MLFAHAFARDVWVAGPAPAESTQRARGTSFRKPRQGPTPKSAPPEVAELQNRLNFRTRGNWCQRGAPTKFVTTAVLTLAAVSEPWCASGCHSARRKARPVAIRRNARARARRTSWIPPLRSHFEALMGHCYGALKNKMTSAWCRAPRSAARRAQRKSYTHREITRAITLNSAR